MKNIFHIVLTTLLFVGLSSFATAQSHVTPTPTDMYADASNGLADSKVLGHDKINSVKSKKKEMPKFMIGSMRDNMTHSRQKSMNNKQVYILAKKLEVQ